MVMTLEEMVTDFREAQLKNAPISMVVTLEGMVTDVREMQSVNALSPIVMTVEGILTVVLVSGQSINIVLDLS